jgi:hypothetical protein
MLEENGRCFLLNILQFCNTYTQEVIREERYKMPGRVMSIINDCNYSQEHGTDFFVMGSDGRLWKADYVTHSVHKEAGTNTYRLFFRLQSSGFQLPRKPLAQN